MALQENKGNLTSYLEKMNSLYSKILEQGKDLYLLGPVLQSAKYVVGLQSKERKKNTEGKLILDEKDIMDLYEIFPELKDKSVEFLEGCYTITPYTQMHSEENLTPKGLEKILKGKPVFFFNLVTIN